MQANNRNLRLAVTILEMLQKPLGHTSSNTAVTSKLSVLSVSIFSKSQKSISNYIKQKKRFVNTNGFLVDNWLVSYRMEG